MSREFLWAGAGVWAVFLAVQIGAIALAGPLVAADVSVGDDPSDPRFGVAFVIGLLLATAILLTAFKFGLDRLIRGLIFVVAVGVTWFVGGLVIPPVLTAGGVNLLALGGAVGLALVTVRYPRWWVINVQAIILGIGIAALFGSSLGVFPVVVFLVLLALYDAVSVYGTKHMLTLAEDAVSNRLPVLVIVPTTRRALRTLDPGAPAETAENNEDDGGDALYIGLGDVAIPAILVVSASVYSPVDPFTIGTVAITIPAIGAMAGIAIGLAGLLWLISTGRPHAGLPLLNTGVITGYLLGALLVGIGPLEALTLVSVAPSGLFG